MNFRKLNDALLHAHVAAVANAKPTSQRKARVDAAIRVGAAGTAVLLFSHPASAQSLKDAGVNIFTLIYGIVGVLGGIACLIAVVNWLTGNVLAREDPKKFFFQCVGGTAVGFSVPALLQWAKARLADTTGDITRL